MWIFDRLLWPKMYSQEALPVWAAEADAEVRPVLRQQPQILHHHREQPPGHSDECKCHVNQETVLLDVLMMTIVVLKIALACWIYPFASQNLWFTDSKLFSTLQNCSCSPSTSSSKASPSEWTPSLSNPSNDSPGNQSTHFEHNRFFTSPSSLMGYNPSIHPYLI